MKVKLRKEMILSLFLLLPYAENNFTQKYLQTYFDHSYIRAITILSALVIIFPLVGILIRHSQNRISGIKIIKPVLIATIAYLTISSFILTTDFVLSFCEWLWVVTPIIFAMIVTDYFEVKKIDVRAVIKYGIIWFTLYLSMVLVYYVAVHHLFFDRSVRMNPRGGGAVIFGYTIALYFALTLIFKEQFRKGTYYAILAILSIGSFATVSRGSVWIVLLLWIANYIFEKLTTRRLMVFIILTPIFIWLASIDFSAYETTTFIGIGRLLNVNSFRRVTSTISIFDVFGEQSLISKIFGTGLGNFFPYQRWSMFINDVDENMFSYLGKSILVQPHNSFLYTLMEGGLIGFILLILSFVRTFIQIIKNKNNRWLYKVIFVAAMIVFNLLDSVFYVQPGTAYAFWLLLFLVIHDDKVEKYLDNSSI